jgi:tRNA G18 (ribose-2'-O)-methylase SpoU
VAWEYIENAAEATKALRDQGYRIIIIEQTTDSTLLDQLSISKDEKYCIVFGNEVNGVSDEVIEHGHLAVEIPQSGTKHSLNISVCVGIIAWEFAKQLR